MISIQFFKTPAGELIIGDHEGKICLCDWRYRKQRANIDQRITSALKAAFVERKTDAIAKIQSQLEEYFAGQRQEFQLDLLPIGTPFQQKVWDKLQTIKYGETRSYLQLSQQLGDEKAIRAVASANGANPLAILIPCHRIIGSQGQLTGYAGGLEAKRFLLKLEGTQLPGRQLELF